MFRNGSETRRILWALLTVLAALAMGGGRRSGIARRVRKKDREHVVAPGEDLYHLAVGFGLALEHLAFANGWEPPAPGSPHALAGARSQGPAGTLPQKAWSSTCRSAGLPVPSGRFKKFFPWPSASRAVSPPPGFLHPDQSGGQPHLASP